MVPPHTEERESEIATQAEANRGSAAELTAQLEEFDRGGRGGPHHPQDAARAARSADADADADAESREAAGRIRPQ
ncbi:hypothetical protein GCM10027075_50640 [Streptomyces heilongjiangensis]